MPRPGGEADKIGNQYEALWTVEQLLDLVTGDLLAITVEAHGPEAEGVEFHVETSAGVFRYHSVKRQKQNGDWSIAKLTSKDQKTGRSILGDLFGKLDGSSYSEICFVSATGANALRELVERAQHAGDLRTFSSSLSQLLLDDFDKIVERIGVSEDETFDKLHSLEVATKSHALLQRDVDRRIQSLLYPIAGGPSSALDVRLRLADFVYQELGRRIDRPRLLSWLEDNGIGLRDWKVDKTTQELVDRQNKRYLSSVTAELINSALIPRSEADDLLAILESSQGRGSLLVAAGGYGKSCVLAQVASVLEQRGLPFLCLRLDSVQSCTTSAELGRQLDLPASPASVLAGIADTRPCVLIVDQLDALSIVSGRRPELWQAFQELCEDAKAYPNLRLLVATREFDLRHDYRLRPLGQKGSGLTVINLGQLKEKDVNESLKTAGRENGLLTDEECQLLRVPIHLLLFLEGDSSDGFATVGSLFDSFWRRKRQAVRDRLGREPNWKHVIDRLTQHMSNEQVLQAPKAALGDWESDAEAMVSEGVLVLTGNHYRFFHETFFDYAYARRLCASSISLVKFLTSTEQHLFRRAQTRQILAFRRDNDREQYLRDLGDVLGSESVRFHIRRMVASWLKTIEAPEADEWRVVSPFLLEGELTGPVSGALLSHTGWFDVLHKEGVFEQWLASGIDKLIHAALFFLEDLRIHDDRSAEIAGLLEPYVDAGPEWTDRLIRVFSWSIAHKSEAMGRIFLALVARGAFDDFRRDQSNTDFWHLSYHAAEEKPRFFIDVLAVWYDRAVTQIADGKYRPFDTCSNNHSLTGALLVGKAAGSDPRYFVEQLFPRFIQTVLDTQEQGPDGVGCLAWRHLSNSADPIDIDDSILWHLAKAMGALARDDSPFCRLQSVLCADMSHPPDSFVLLTAWAENPNVFADDCVAYLTADPARLGTSYSIVIGNQGNNACSITRQCLSAVTPYCSEEGLLALENAILGYCTNYERRTPRLRGSNELLLLRSLDKPRRSKRAQLRIEELERKFPDLSDSIVTEQPRGSSFSWNASPIPEHKARLMKDTQWISAMEKYGSERDLLRGGRHELSRSLRECTRKERKRFSEIAAMMPDSLHPDYFSAILDGLSGRWNQLSETELKADKADRDSLSTETFVSVIERLHTLPNKPCGSSIAMAIEALADRSLPDQLLELLCYYARHDPDPQEEEADDLETQSINCTRGHVAIAVASLLCEDPRRYSKLAGAIDSLLGDDFSAVRVAAIGALCAMLNFDRDQAVSIFVSAVSDRPPIWATQSFVKFINYSTRSHYGELRPVMLTALEDGSDDATKNAAQQIALAELCEFGGHCAEDDLRTVLESRESARAAAAGVYAHNLEDPILGDRAAERLRELFDDEADKVAEEVSRAFYGLDGARLLALEDLMGDYIESPSFRTGRYALFHALNESCIKLPAIIYRGAERAVELSGPEVTHIASQGALHARDVSAVIVREYEQTTDPDTKNRCLNIIDEMEQIGFYGLDDELRRIDR